LFSVGSTTVNISSDRAIEIAKNAIKSYAWTANGQTISDFKVLSEPVKVVFHPITKQGLALYPCWYVTLYLDKVYPTNVNSIGVGVWADTGEVALMQTSSS
jgi:hypothetical protein